MREHQQRGVEVLAASGEQCVAELRALEAEVAEQYKADEGALVAQAEAGGWLRLRLGLGLRLRVWVRV